MLPLRSLAPSKYNVRRFASEAGIEELCANISRRASCRASVRRR
jgi:hypothetical protein